MEKDRKGKRRIRKRGEENGKGKNRRLSLWKSDERKIAQMGKEERNL